MNEENNRDSRTEEAEVVNEEVNCVSREEVKNALRRMKTGKAVGPDEFPVEVWKCMGKMGIKFLTRLFNRLLMGERMPLLRDRVRVRVPFPDINMDLCQEREPPMPCLL